MNTFRNIVCTAILTCSSAVVLACDAPSKPDLPDPETAVTPQMVKAKNDVKSYLAAAEAFLGCTKSTKQHNNMVDDMKTVADDFNAIVRAYKARMSG